MRLRLLSPLLLAAALAACGSRDTPDKVIDIAGINALSAADQLIIEKRLTDDDGHAGTRRTTPKVSFAARDGHVDVRTNTAPAADTDTSFLLKHQGRFRIVNEASQTLVDQAGIADAYVVGKDGLVILALKLTDSAAKRLAALSTTAGSGERLRVELDDDVLSTPMLSVPLSKSVQMSINRPVAAVELIARIVRSGPLSFQPQDVKVRAPDSSS